jgi:hypothetical protein
LGFVTHGFIKRALTRNRRPSRRFSTAPCCLEFAAMLCFNASQLGGALAFRQWATKSFLERSNSRGLLACDPFAGSANFAGRQPRSPTSASFSGRESSVPPSRMPASG